MKLYIILSIAIALEVFGTMLLPFSQNFTKIIPSFLLIISYTLSFYFLAYLSQKLSLAILYSSWAGMGLFLVTILSYFIYKQTINWQTFIGLLLIALGVVIVNIYKTQPI